tara:strand:- start:910 stop:1062 length:153 start_codon:yes stop_codon:yes gene_type:complete
LEKHSKRKSKKTKKIDEKKVYFHSFPQFIHMPEGKNQSLILNENLKNNSA